MVACLCLGVLARVIVGSAVHDVSSAVERESRELVGADLIFSADTNLDETRRAELASFLPRWDTARHLSLNPDYGLAH